MNLDTTLADGITALGIDLSPLQQQQLLDYVGLLSKWNKAYNLTAVRDPVDMVVRHLLDSLSVLPHVQATEIIDVGTGAGIPGIPLAIALPSLRVTLLDSNGKKTRFARQAALELGLTNVEVVQARAEQYRNASPQVISRAFASLPDMLDVAGHLLAPGGRMLAMKAALSDVEMAGVQAPWQAERITLKVPGLDERRQLMILTSDVA
ncbi:16S rRNA (guanine(527)-N(7))-methyltransferase RsmG [Alcanivorax sp. 1008]|uniref:16S rRNA (guanine(527)-N(7))-methyltransferase RsmG n=1 Tax=Alcanivorax sp. 1008 TaxID=2816853 RepID=UPI001DB0287B|nr:16S rRNA (guanine(527)-N(7))-methyltransferase RsmG [Alcanivorax sp. 1008]MCC1496139.1 16S rRNA (guanine(527)-N(7))-methyltransferase RsmG [Alcanivorax sp. 1008]